MKKITLLVGLLTSIGCFGSLVAQEQGHSRQDTVVAAGKAFVGLLAKGDYAGCVAQFDSTMTAVMPAEKVQEMWVSVAAQSGAFKKQLGARSMKYKSYDIIFVTCEFERDTLDTRVVFDTRGKIAGLFFAKAQAPAEYHPPAYAKRETFREDEVTVGTGEWALPGTLAMPVGQKRVPAIVLVHGSGPNDRDETIGPNEPFRDLAWGLASRGVAVLRYEKRTREHGQQLLALRNTFTVKEESIDDALSAVALLGKTDGIDPNRIFVLGHSLGGMLAPRIGKLNSHLAGLIILAGPARPLEDLMVEQTEYLLSLRGAVSDQEKKQVELVKDQRDRIKTLKRSDTSSTEMLLAAPVAYWLDLGGFDPSKVAATLSMPLFILQGERDYQVTMEDFGRWKAALQSKGNVTLKSYPNLNHLFVPGEGKSVPTEYERAGNVSVFVIDDIADWVKK
jgi:fermentation-respiration switch protein FrsA (DUF1100 family)